MTFKKSVVRGILNRCDIVDVIGTFLPLKPRGEKPETEYVTLCPFHSERKPSFTVTRMKQFYHCFGCGAHGSAISFIREYTGVSYGDAIKKVAELSGYKFPNGKSNPSNKKILERRWRRKKLKKKEDAIQQGYDAVIFDKDEPDKDFRDDEIPF